MGLKNTYNSYGSLAKWFHWLSFLLIVGLIAVGFYMEGMPKGPEKGLVVNAHKATGIAVFFLLLLRFVWKLMNQSPELPKGLNLFEKILSILGHYALYFLSIMMPLSGWIASTAANRLPHIGTWTLPGFPFIPHTKAVGSCAHSIHVTGVWVLIAMITLHVLAALRHHFVMRDSVLRRMFPYGNALE